MNRKIRNILLMVLAVPILIVVALLLFAEWAWGGRVQTSLDPQYVPTAQFLMQNPKPTPSFVNIDPPPSSVISTGERIDVGVNSWRLSVSISDVWDWTRFYINNVRMDYSEDIESGVGGSLMPPAETYQPFFWFSPQLQPGFHLIEIRISTSITALLNPAETRTYTWAYQVE